MSLGRGCITNISSKQKINTRSSTEAELIAANDVMGQILWTKNVLCSLGYATKASTLYQDNQSTMLLEKNGKFSSSKRTKRINVRYFFIKDQIDREEICVIYCPTEYATAG